MKTQFLLAATMALSLTACGKPADSDAAANKVAESTKPTEAAPTAVSATTSAAADTVTNDFMVGKWVEESDGDCKLAQDFKADGSVDGFFESWKLEGSNLVVTVMGETQTMAVKVIDPKRIESKMNGKAKMLIRC